MSVILNEVVQTLFNLSETEVATAIGLSVADLRSTRTIAKEQIVLEQTRRAEALREKGVSIDAIAKEMGIPKATVNQRLVNSEKIKLEKELAYKNNKLFSGLAFKSTDGYVSSGTFYKMGVKKAYFEFDNGFMNRALIYTSPKNYTEYKYMSYNFLKGVAYTITIFVNDVENGPYTTYYEDGWRFEGTFKDGKLIGTGYYYDENNKIKEVHQYLNDTYKSTLYFDYDKKSLYTY